MATKIVLDGNSQRTYDKAYEFIARTMDSVRSHNEEKPGDFLRIFSKESKKEYRLALPIFRFLEEMKEIEIDDDYSNSATRTDGKYGYPKGIRLSFRNRKVEPIRVEPVLSQAELDFQDIEMRVYLNRDKVPKCKIDEATHILLTKQVIVEEAKDWWRTADITVTRVRSIKIHLTKLRQGIANDSRSEIVERFGHILAYMPKEGRRFIKFIDGSNFTCLDIGSSHLFQMVAKNEPHTAELQKQIDDGLYNVVANKIGVTNDKKFKVSMMQYFYSAVKRKDIADAVAELWPNVSDLVMKVSKKTFWYRKEYGRTLSHQNLMTESNIIYQVRSSLYLANIPCYSIYDSVAVPCAYSDATFSIMREVYRKHFGLVPKIKSEILN